MPRDFDAGNYCRARARLSIDALHELVVLVVINTETFAPTDWLRKNRHHAKLVDGFTTTTPDTATNPAKFPQHEKQHKGCDFPIVRIAVVVVIVSGAAAVYFGIIRC